MSADSDQEARVGSLPRLLPEKWLRWAGVGLAAVIGVGVAILATLRYLDPKIAEGPGQTVVAVGRAGTQEGTSTDKVLTTGGPGGSIVSGVVRMDRRIEDIEVGILAIDYDIAIVDPASRAIQVSAAAMTSTVQDSGSVDGALRIMSIDVTGLGLPMMQDSSGAIDTSIQPWDLAPAGASR